MAAALNLGTAAVLIEACYEEARKRGIFGSLLLDFQKAQNELAEAAAEQALVRVQTYRALILLDGGHGKRGFQELYRAWERAEALVKKMSALASDGYGMKRSDVPNPALYPRTASVDVGPSDTRTLERPDFQKGREP